MMPVSLDPLPSPRLILHRPARLIYPQTELAKLNRKYVNAGPAIQEEKRRLAATIAEMNAQYDEHRLALEGMRCVRACARACVYVCMCPCLALFVLCV